MRTLTTLLSLLICLSANAQVAQTAMPRDVTTKRIIDSLTLKVTYRARIATDTIAKGAYFDNHILEIGKKYNRYYSALAEEIDSVKYKVQNGMMQNDGDFFLRTMTLGKNEDGTYEDIFTDFPNKGKDMVYTRFLNQTYIYQEPTPTFKWTITDTKDTIIGYECFEARTFFRGRNYIAWFTLDIPISAGPRKLKGLPGLILKAQDTDGLFQYTAIGIENHQNMPMYMYEQKTIKCSRKDIMRLNDLRWENFDLLVQTISGRKVVNINHDGKIVDGTMEIPQYIPQLELE